MTVESEVRGRSGWIVLRGGWDTDAATQLGDSARQLLRGRVAELVLDFSAADNVDGTVVPPLVDVFKQANDGWAEVRLVHLPADIRTILEVTQLDKVMGLDT